MSKVRKQKPGWQQSMMLSELTGSPQNPDCEITGITADSRMVKPGFLFAALKGETIDGASFIPQAKTAGAVAVLATADVKTDLPLIAAEEPRLTLSRIAARFHAGQPAVVVGITGTNGKTSVANFSRQLWSMLGIKAGSLGTLGAFSPGYDYSLRHTTPDPVEIHQVLSTMEALGTTHLAMEVSSHGLSQYRADAVQFSHVAFCNITQDHLDYHQTFEEYFEAKLRLFKELLPQSGIAVINQDGAGADRIAKAVEARGAQPFFVGRGAKGINLVSVTPHPTGLRLEVEAEKISYQLDLPLYGDFQAENALVAAGLVMATGFDAKEVLPLLSKLEGAPGRMQKVGERTLGTEHAGIYVDFAHTPDALERALASIRPHARNKVHLIFGAGGDRDKAKRALMGKAAGDGADMVIITDDNPRTEDPEHIRKELFQACPKATMIADRRAAIKAGLSALEAGDILLIAGKGHESGQTVGTVTLPFNDGVVAREELEKLDGVSVRR